MLEPYPESWEDPWTGRAEVRWHHRNTTCRGLCEHENFCYNWYSFQLDIYEALAREETQA